METLSKKVTFTDVFDRNLSTILFSYLSFDDYMNGLYRLNKDFASYFRNSSDYIWKIFF